MLVYTTLISWIRLSLDGFRLKVDDEEYGALERKLSIINAICLRTATSRVLD